MTKSHLCSTEELGTDYWVSKVVQITEIVYDNTGMTVMNNFEPGALHLSWLARGSVSHGGRLRKQWKVGSRSQKSDIQCCICVCGRQRTKHHCKTL